MAQENQQQNTASSSEEDTATLQKSIDLYKLAEKIVSLLLKEISIETERTGR